MAICDNFADERIITQLHKRMETETKYIFITGGVTSSLGKGII